MEDTARVSGVARALAVLAVLVGLLAMHGLASTHHASAAPAAHHARTTEPVRPPHAAVGELHDVIEAVPSRASEVPADSALAVPAGPQCVGACSTMTALCLAVLFGAGTALLLSRHSALAAGRSLARRVMRRPGCSVRYARGPDPVRELCISRT